MRRTTLQGLDIKALTPAKPTIDAVSTHPYLTLVHIRTGSVPDKGDGEDIECSLSASLEVGGVTSQSRRSYH